MAQYPAAEQAQVQGNKVNTEEWKKPSKSDLRGGASGRYGHGVAVARFFTKSGVQPFDTLEWDYRSAKISSDKGEVIFEQTHVEVPKSWSQLATSVVVSKYFRGKAGTPERETSVKQLIDRVARTIAEWGRKDGYFQTPEDAQAFYDELTHILVTQKMAFNSPVWFNVGIEERPQCSACFINSVQDSMSSILDLAKTEGMLFKYGSGTGTNLSPLRSSREHLSTGGIASGPVSFMRGYDAFAGVIKSGGRTRRAAKMVILNIDHPDIVEFIRCKELEEKKAWALIDAGYDGSVNGEAYGSVFFQNSNNSVRVTDEFMRAVLDDKEWETRAVTDSQVVDTFRARDLMKQIAEAAWVCGDPGLQFDTTINDWHTCSNTDRIHASNPCSEYMFLNDTACNLASINLMKCVDENGEFDPAVFNHIVDVTILAQEILVDNAKYPTDRIAEMSHRYRTLGLGYANLGALLMSRGLPYDSDEGRNYAAAITALMSGRAYRQSARIAEKHGPFPGFAENREPMLRVIEKHKMYVGRIVPRFVPDDMMKAAALSWQEALDHGRASGYRNAQISVLAPTGTIAFMMDCDTTGIEPDIALIKYKKLVGGGVLKIVNNTVPMALARLGYPTHEIQDIVNYINREETIEGAPHLKAEHLPVFDCAFKPTKGSRTIHYRGHIRMMGAVQPFISGAISKTVNMPHEATPDEVAQTYLEAWKLGLKAIAIYRDGCKRSQPLNTSKENDTKTKAKVVRRRLPDERQSITHKFSVAGHDGYITVGMYEDGAPGEVFIVMSKEGSTVSGLMDSLATSISISLQYGVPLKVLVDKFTHTRFEPSGFTSNKQIPIAKSISDYIFRWLALKFLPSEDQPSQNGNGTGTRSLNDTTVMRKAAAAAAAANAAPPAPAAPPAHEAETSPREARERQVFLAQADAPPCPDCGALMVRNAACYKCLNCGTTNGCS